MWRQQTKTKAIQKQDNTRSWNVVILKQDLIIMHNVTNEKKIRVSKYYNIYHIIVT